MFIFKTTWKSYFKNNEKNTWKFTKKSGNIMEFYQSEKVGTLPNLLWVVFKSLLSLGPIAQQTLFGRREKGIVKNKKEKFFRNCCRITELET